MTRATLSLGAVLGLSLLVNVLALHRLGRRAPETPSRPTVVERTVAGAQPPPGVDKLDFVLTELSMLRRQVAGLQSKEGGVAPAPDVPVSSSRDPELARILADQERWDAMLGDLRKLSAARGQIGDDRYFQSVLDATADPLGLRDPQRSAFIETARTVLRDLDRARRELEQSFRADPRPSREQMQAAVAGYRTQQTAAQERLAAQLDVAQPAQKQFSTQLSEWMRAVGGSSSPRWAGRRVRGGSDRRIGRD